jgi:hypothetical protein
LPQIHRGLKPIEAERRDLLRRPFAVDAVISIRRARPRKRMGASSPRAPCPPSSPCRATPRPSCNARILIEGGYRLMQVTPVEFRYAAHVEIVARFVR